MKDTFNVFSVVQVIRAEINQLGKWYSLENKVTDFE